MYRIRDLHALKRSNCWAVQIIRVVTDVRDMQALFSCIRKQDFRISWGKKWAGLVLPGALLGSPAKCKSAVRPGTHSSWSSCSSDPPESWKTQHSPGQNAGVKPVPFWPHPELAHYQPCHVSLARRALVSSLTSLQHQRKCSQYIWKLNKRIVDFPSFFV